MNAHQQLQKACLIIHSARKRSHRQAFTEGFGLCYRISTCRKSRSLSSFIEQVLCQDIIFLLAGKYARTHHALLDHSCGVKRKKAATGVLKG